MTEFLSQPGYEHDRMAIFRQESLEQLAAQLQTRNYPGYPALNERLWDDRPAMYTTEPIYLPYGPWETSNGELPSILERIALGAHCLRVDCYGRPLHPWFDAMLSDPRVGVVTGKGFYWKWGPNYTADPIVIRRDMTEPHVLLITRSDTGQLALPGGFVDIGEDSVDAAFREAAEETGLDFKGLDADIHIIYHGPVADIRTTANAWAETTAVKIELPDEYAKTLPFGEWQGGDDAMRAAWVPLAAIGNVLFGSHRLLVDLALRQ